MDYHLVDNLEGFDKPLFFWTKQDFLTYVQFIDALSEAIKADYQKIANHKKDTGTDLLADEQRQQVQNAIVEWARQQSIFIDESENPAFPFASDINKADYQYSQLEKASNIVTSVLAQIGVQSDSAKAKEDIEPTDKPGALQNIESIVKWGVIGLGVYIAYQVFRDIRR